MPSGQLKALKLDLPWWQYVLMLTALIVALQQQWTHRNMQAIIGTVQAVQISAEQNRANSGCVIVYRYALHYQTPAGQNFASQRSQSEQSQTCGLKEARMIKAGDLETIYIDPKHPEIAQDGNIYGIFAWLFLALCVLSIGWRKLMHYGAKSSNR
jgi:hypothetical protein